MSDRIRSTYRTISVRAEDLVSGDLALVDGVWREIKQVGRCTSELRALSRSQQAALRDAVTAAPVGSVQVGAVQDCDEAFQVSAGLAWGSVVIALRSTQSSPGPFVAVQISVPENTTEYGGGRTNPDSWVVLRQHDLMQVQARQEEQAW